MDGDVCAGCGRTTEEIVAWRDGPESLHAEAWRALPDRQAQIKMDMRPLPWRREHLVQFLATSVAENVGTWVAGISGAVAEFYVPPNETPTAGTDELGRATATYGPHGISLWAPEKARPLAVPVAPDDTRLDSLVVVLPNGRLGLPQHDGLTEVDDVDAGVHHRAFDLGLGAANARFVVTVKDHALADTMASRAGAAATDVLADLGADLVRHGWNLREPGSERKKVEPRPADQHRGFPTMLDVP